MGDAKNSFHHEPLRSHLAAGVRHVQILGLPNLRITGSTNRLQTIREYHSVQIGKMTA
jgi:hypothetical protein